MILGSIWIFEANFTRVDRVEYGGLSSVVCPCVVWPVCLKLYYSTSDLSRDITFESGRKCKQLSVNIISFILSPASRPTTPSGKPSVDSAVPGAISNPLDAGRDIG
jgi:hypothetical protein